jgi:hypothetical protein
MVSSNCNAAGQPLNPNDPILGWNKRRSADPALKKRQMGASWTDSGSPPPWLGGTGGGTGSGTGGGTGGGTGSSGGGATGGGASAPAVAAPGVAPAGAAPPLAVIPASPASAPPIPQGQAPGGNQLLFAGAPKLSHGLAYVLAAGLATSVALLI